MLLRHATALGSTEGEPYSLPSRTYTKQQYELCQPGPVNVGGHADVDTGLLSHLTD